MSMFPQIPSPDGPPDPTVLFMCSMCGGSFDTENAERYDETAVLRFCETLTCPTCVQDENTIRQAARLVDDLSRPIYVFRMARACPDKPGSRERMLNAAKEIIQILEDE